MNTSGCGGDSLPLPYGETCDDEKSGDGKRRTLATLTNRRVEEEVQSTQLHRGDAPLTDDFGGGVDQNATYEAKYQTKGA